MFTIFFSIPFNDVTVIIRLNSFPFKTAFFVRISGYNWKFYKFIWTYTFSSCFPCYFCDVPFLSFSKECLKPSTGATFSRFTPLGTVNSTLTVLSFCSTGTRTSYLSYDLGSLSLGFNVTCASATLNNPNAKIK